MREVKFGKPLLGDEEKRAVAEVLEGDILVHGPKAKEFEAAFANFTGAPFAISTSNCTAALHLCHFYFGTGPGDEVIVPAMSHTATAHAVELTGAKPVFVDAESITGNVDIGQIESKITDRTVGISVVHFLGMPVAMDKVIAIAEKHKLYVIEDCALSPGAYYKGKHTGLYGDAGCFSFYPVKHITTGEGGMLITIHQEMAEKTGRQRAFGVDRTAGERKVPGVYDVNLLGFNYRMSEIHAVIGIEQVKRLFGFIKKRKENYEALTNGLKEIEEVQLFKSTGEDFVSNYYCHQVLLNKALTPKRYEIVSTLKENGIGTSVYYPEAIPHFTYYCEKYNYREGMFPVAEMISKSSISLPVAPHLNIDDMLYIVEILKQSIREVNKL
jgi:dTDP-4-amino-4,6-dideoxygalactose transaminase